MIKSESQLKVVRAQLGNLEAALESLRAEVRPQNEKMYALMAEPYIDEILMLRAEVDAYLGINRFPVNADLVLSLQGDLVRLGKTSAGAVTRLIDTFRRGLQSIVEILEPGSGQEGGQEGGRRRHRWIENICDLPLVAIEAGSVRVALGEPAGESLFKAEERETLSHAMNVLFEGLAWADETNGTQISSKFPGLDEHQVQAILAVIARLLPPRSGAVEQVGFERRVRGEAGTSVEEAKLTRESRQRIKEALALIANTSQYAELDGVIRSVDLDARTFVLRERPNDAADLPCEYGPELEEAVKEYLDNRVIVSGVLETSRKTNKSTMAADSIERLSSEEAPTSTSIPTH